MTTLNSNTATASLIATSIANSLDGLSSGGIINSDSETTISGNGKAKEAIQAISDTRDSVLKAVGTASTNLQSVANEFEAVDKKLREVFTSPIPNSVNGVNSGSQGATGKAINGLFSNPIPTFNGGSN